MNIEDFKKFIPLDKSWLTRVGVLDIINNYSDIEEFIGKQNSVNDDILAIKNASRDWRNNLPIDVGESATLCRLLQFASWKFNLQKVFVKHGSLNFRNITNDPKIVSLDQSQLLKLDNETTQWATAAVICGDKERLPNAPLKLKETYIAVEHWHAQRKKGQCWEIRYDNTIERQVDTFLKLLNHEEVYYHPLCSDDYCFARVFNFINKENGVKLWPSLVGHETNRIEEMERAIEQAETGNRVNSRDHRVIQAVAMWGVVKNKKIAFNNKDCINKSWPQFWDFLTLIKRKAKFTKLPIHTSNYGNTDKDKVINLILQEVESEKKTISLVPSENVMSRFATSMYALKSNNRYMVKSKIGSRYFMPGRENLGNLIAVLESKLCSIYGTEFAITKGLSGIHGMDMVMSAISNISNKIIILNTLSGGHSKTKGIAVRNGFEVEMMDLDFNTWDLDYKKLSFLVKKWRKEKVFIYIDQTVCVNPLNIDKLIKYIPKHWIVYCDISHLQLFYFTHIFEFPKSVNLFFGGSTHKTFPGPQKSVILLNNKVLYDLVDAEFVKNTSSVHTGSLLALLVSVLEMEKFGRKYGEDILQKTKFFAKLLSKELNVIGPMPNLSNTHQICIDVPNTAEVTQKLALIGVITMPMRLPSKHKSGLRLGIQELCRLGVRNKDIEILSKIVISCIKEDQARALLKRQVEALATKLLKVRYSLN